MSENTKEINVVNVRRGISLPFIGVFGPALLIVSLVLFISAIWNWGSIAGWADSYFTTNRIQEEITWFIKCMRIGDC